MSPVAALSGLYHPPREGAVSRPNALTPPPSLRVLTNDAFHSVGFGCGAHQTHYHADPRIPNPLPPKMLTDVDWNNPVIKQQNLITKAMLWVIRQYQLWTRKPADPNLRRNQYQGHEHQVLAHYNNVGQTVSAGCPHYPNCSQYGVQALIKHGWFTGGLKTLKRVLWTCNPITLAAKGYNLSELRHRPRSIYDPV